MRVLADDGDHEVEALVRRDGKQVVVEIADDVFTFDVEEGDGGRLELSDPEGVRTLVELVGTDLRVDGLAYPLRLRKAPPKVEGAMKGGGAGGGGTSVRPPMPGKIVKVSVQAGDHVQPGEVLVILEAMKMQNEIVSPVEGTVKSVEVQEGESIDAKRVICEIE